MFSALSSNSDIARCIRHVSKVPISDSRTAAQIILFDHLIGGREQIQRDLSRRNAAPQRAGARDIAPLPSTGENGVALSESCPAGTCRNPIFKCSVSAVGRRSFQKST